MKAVLRASRIGRVILRYRLDDLLQGTPAERWLRLAKPFVPRASASIASQSRGARLRLALQDLGPIFVKFGQILSTRRDLVPPDVANELTLLQDRVKPFDGETARRIVEDALGLPVSEAFASFDTEPLASASIAQVHAATLADGRQVVVKVLRPGIEKQIDADIALLNSLAALVERTHPRADKIRPREVVAEVENTLAAELDLQREGANASVLRRFWENSDDLYVPEVIWSHTAERALTLERVWGIPSDDIAALDKAGIDRKALAAKGVRVFYTQVFRDNFFHADAHAGNIWVDTDPARRANPRFIALDFGIMGQLSQEDQYYLAENFMAIFNRDYRRIAELHVQARWMPDHVRIDDLEAAVRSVCEPYFTRPLSQISLAEVLMKLFRVGAALPADAAAAADPAAEDPAEHRGRRPPAGPADRHLGGGQAGAGEDPARALQPAPGGARAGQAPAGNHDPCAGHAAAGARLADPAGGRPPRTGDAFARSGRARRQPAAPAEARRGRDHRCGPARHRCTDVCAAAAGLVLGRRAGVELAVRCGRRGGAGARVVALTPAD